MMTYSPARKLRKPGLSRQASAPPPSGCVALLHFRRKVAHGLLRDGTPLAMGKGSVGLIDCGKNFRADTFAFFP